MRIERWYDRFRRIWVVQLFDQFGREITQEYGVDAYVGPRSAADLREKEFEKVIRAALEKTLSICEPEDEDWGICTRSAEWFAKLLRGKLVGYYHEYNPKAEIGELELGHDFVVVADRWIVDYWYKDYYGGNPVYDMRRQRELVGRLYGDSRKWEVVADFTTGRRRRGKGYWQEA